MRGIAMVLLAAMTAFAADDAWTKVRELKSGTELRIFKKGGLHPIIAKMEEANPESLIIVVKNEELAIPREQIDRIDYRPVRGPRVTRKRGIGPGYGRGGRHGAAGQCARRVRQHQHQPGDRRAAGFSNRLPAPAAGKRRNSATAERCSPGRHPRKHQGVGTLYKINSVRRS